MMSGHKNGFDVPRFDTMQCILTDGHCTIPYCSCRLAFRLVQCDMIFNDCPVTFNGRPSFLHSVYTDNALSNALH